MSKHTPGPWHQDKWGSVKAPSGESVKFGALTLSMGHSAEIQANDRLVAAAPELLEALQLAGFSAGYQYMTDETRAVISAAIAKATGAEP